MRNPIKTAQDLANFQVNRVDQLEVIRQTIYDFQVYVLAGVNQQTFFTVPAGTAAKTLASTNMTLAGTLPAPLRLLIQAIEIYFFPGQLPSVGPQADAPSTFVNDLWKFMTGASAAGNVFNTGFLQLNVGSKPYLIEGGSFMRFPPFGRLDGFASVTSTLTAGAATQTFDNYVTAAGRPYIIDPPILLEPTQNFNVTLNWPIAPVPILANANVGIVLNGVIIRNSQ